MILRIFIVLAMTAAAIGAELESRRIELTDWHLTAPADTKEQKHEGPDFMVTRFEFPSLKVQMGIYEGGHPSPFAERAKDVKTMKDNIGGQKAVWSIWNQPSDSGEMVMAETLITSRIIVYPATDGHPGFEYKEQFHIFITAPSQQARVAAQKIVRTLTKVGPIKSVGSTGAK